MINAVFEHEQGYRYNQVYGDKASFRRALNHLKKAKLLHATDFKAGIAVYPSNVFDYLRS